MKVKDIIGNHSQWMPAQDYEVAEPEVSVLLPTFRRAKNGLFEAAVQSVLNQDFKNLELIIIDDASTDGTADLIAHFMRNDPRVSCIRHEYNIGLPAISEYEGYMKARGDYIAFIFDDNEWERDYVSRTINFMVRKQAKAAYGRVRSYYGDGSQYAELGVSNAGCGVSNLHFTNHIANGGVILNKEVVETVGLYDPHVVMTRLCDWNLWKRLVKKYEFFETGIAAGIEKGVMRSDSLGNSYKLNSWAVAERENFQRNNQLLPTEYSEIEINETLPQNTESCIEATRACYRFFKEKKWYHAEKRIVASNRIAIRFLVISDAFSATTDLSFGRILGKSPSIILKFAAAHTVPIYEIIQADAVILVRNLIVLNRFKSVCTALNIPCYYYADDNFLELKKSEKDPIFRQLASYWTLENMCGFSGIFVSTAALKTAMEKEKLNRDVYLLEPIMNFKETPGAWNSAPEKDPLVFAYLGNKFRDRYLLKTVLPALTALSQVRSVHLICPDRLEFDKRYSKLEHLQITQIPFSLSLEETLQRYGAYHPQYLIHCGPSISNNLYKTENALMNAVSLGAVLLASNTEQYRQSAEAGRCVVVENTVEDWSCAFERLSENQTGTKEIYARAKEYCCRRYNVDTAISTLTLALKGREEVGPFDMIERYNAVLFDIFYNNSAMLSADASPAGIMNPANRRSLTEVPLSYSGGIPNERTYYIVSKVETISKLGICFASLGIPAGQVKIQLCTQNRILRELALNFDEYVRDDWTYLMFEPIENAMNVVLSVRLKFEYEDGSDFVGVFEDSTKRSFIYRLCNKFGHPLPIKDLLYADCRE